MSEGTKIVISLKADCAEFADENRVRSIVKKYSSFVGAEINLNGEKASDLRPLWLLNPKDVERETHNDFYRYISGSYDNAR